MTLAPRRCSTDGRWGYPKPEDASRLRVLIDGDMLRGVVAYDVDEGWADVLLWGDDGDPVMRDGQFVATRRTGQIKVYLV